MGSLLWTKDVNLKMDKVANDEGRKKSEVDHPLTKRSLFLWKTSPLFHKNMSNDDTHVIAKSHAKS
jgi:hypothetical protein